MKKKVLIIVDVQNDFCPGGALAVKEGDQTIPVIKTLIKELNYDLVIATQDWHPANHSSFASKHVGKNVFDRVSLNGVEQTLWPNHCVQNSPGAEIHSDLANDATFQQALSLIVTKGTNPEIDSYSAFFDNQRLGETSLRKYLQDYADTTGLTISDLELHFTGLALDYCVKFSVLDARSLGYSATLILDATRAVNLSPEDDLKALRELIHAGVEVVSSKDLIQRAHELQPTIKREQSLQP